MERVKSGWFFFQQKYGAERGEEDISESQGLCRGCITEGGSGEKTYAL